MKNSGLFLHLEVFGKYDIEIGVSGRDKQIFLFLLYLRIHMPSWKDLCRLLFPILKL